MSVPREGGCACGAVRYRLTSDPLFTHCCHCLNCQRQTGSAFVINLLIEAGQRVSGTVRLALEVTDSESIARRLVAAGAAQVAPPVTTPWGDRNARVRAPDGMQLTLFTAP